MKIFNRNIISIMICILIVLSAIVPVAASNSEKLEIDMTVGSSIMIANSEKIDIEKPVVFQNTVFVPLNAILRVLGAELNWLGQGKVNIVYRNVEINFEIGKKEYEVNQVKKQFSSAPKLINGKTMIPIQLFNEDFGISYTYDTKSKKIVISQDDDGALSDLSFLIGGISKDKIGNSYFGWSINIPKGSRVSANTFSSKYISIENEHRQIDVEIYIDAENKKDINQYYKDRVDSSDSDSMVDSSISSDSCDFLYLNTDEEAAWEKVFVNKSYVYHLVLTSYNDTNPLKLSNDEYYKGLMNSFKLDYKGNSKDIQDLSNVKYGFANYENYVTLDSGTKYLTWGMDFLPDWDVISTTGNDNPMSTRIGLSNKDFIDITTDKLDIGETLDSYVKKIKDSYDENFNPLLYTFIQKKSVEIAGHKAYNLTMNIKSNGKSYIVDESFIVENSMVYDITMKLPEEKYNTDKDTYKKVIETIEIPKIDTEAMFKDLGSYNDKNGNLKVGKDDKLTDVQNKTYNWSASVPGFWEKNYSYSDNMSNYSNPTSGASVAIIVAENTDKTKDMTDEEKMPFLSVIADKPEVKLVKSESINAKNTDIRIYTYRYEDDELDLFADMKIYIIDGKKYTYCFSTMLPDLSSNEKNQNEIQAIWDSFTPVG
jgi:hypothetical protein